MFDNPLHAPSPPPDFPWFPEAPIPPDLDPIPEYDSQTELENLSHQISKMLWEAEEEDLLGERADEDDITAPGFMREEGVLLPNALIIFKSHALMFQIWRRKLEMTFRMAILDISRTKIVW